MTHLCNIYIKKIVQKFIKYQNEKLYNTKFFNISSVNFLYIVQSQRRYNSVRVTERFLW